MSYDKDTFERYLETRGNRFLNELGQFIAQPSVAADGRGIHEMAGLVAERLRELGADVTVYPIEGGSPVVYAEIGPADAPRTLIVYNHYDVQPEDPRELWESDPFMLTIRDGVIYGRGTSDDKGELLARIQAVEAWLATQGELPLRLKWVVEGEEEVGSVHLETWAEQHAEMLRADGVLWEGGGYDDAGRRIFGLGLKGLAYFDLRCQGPAYDLHSSVAPMVENPAWRLIWALSTLKAPDDTITLDGYLEHVIPPDEEALRRIDAIPMDFEALRQRWGLREWLGGMSDEEARRRYYTAPTITICGVHAGYGGPGSKTILPAEARAKLGFRLVNGLTPELAQRLLREHLDRRGFTDVEITLLSGEKFATSPPDSLPERAAVAASEDVWGQTPVLEPWLAGSGPAYPLSAMLGIPLVVAGATWHPNARAHAPNENILVRDYFDAMRFMAAFMAHFAASEA